MIRKHENSDSWKAGGLAIAVHLALLGAMLISFNWKAAHPVLNVTEVELWDKLPRTKPVVVEEPKPEPKPEVKAVPKPVVEEKPKPEESKVDIELEKKKKELEQKEKELEEKHKKDEVTKKLAQQMRDEDLHKNADEKQQQLDKIKHEALSDKKAQDYTQASAPNPSEIGKYIEKIKDQIRSKVNKTSCGDDSLEIRVEINVMPTGQISGSPNITKSSGITSCDQAVERAIMLSEPLPLPDDPSLKAQFKNLKLKFRPNDN